MIENLYFKAERIHKFQGNGTLKAYVDININNVLVIKGFRIVNGPRGLFVSMPQEKGKDKRWYDTVRCLSKEIQAKIAEEVMTTYQNSEDIPGDY